MAFLRNVPRAARIAFSGGLLYRLWLLFLVVVAGWGVLSYVHQAREGLIATHMRDPVSWGFYIGNFTFLVGVAAAAILVVIPAYVYHWKPIKEVSVLGEVLAICAILMAIGFVLVDIGRPERLWHILPIIGRPHLPQSLLTWDTLVLTGYLFLNLIVVWAILRATFRQRDYNKRIITPLILLSIPTAVGIHTVTAFLYNGLAGRPYWNASILAPRFLASAFCSGPAILVIIFQLLQKTTRFKIKQEAIWKLSELMAYAMFVNLFLLGAEVFKEFYSNTQDTLHVRFLFFGFQGHDALVPYAWASLLFSIAAFILLLIPKTRRHPVTLNLGCLLIYFGVYIEKGVGLIIPGFTPDTLGEVYEYTPSWTELGVGAGIFAMGFLLLTLLTKVAVAVLDGQFRQAEVDQAAPAIEKAGQPAT